MGTAAVLDAALAESLEDPSELVRAAALRALGQRGALGYLPELRERFNDEEELPSVRAAAAQALGQLCDGAALPALTETAQALLVEPADADAMLVGSAAIAALGRLHPPDLERRLAGFAQARQRPALVQLAAAALQTTERCRAVAGNVPQR
jgi:HEAT repeat protein